LTNMKAIEPKCFYLVWYSSPDSIICLGLLIHSLNTLKSRTGSIFPHMSSKNVLTACLRKKIFPFVRKPKERGCNIRWIWRVVSSNDPDPVQFSFRQLRIPYFTVVHMDVQVS
jgi:hypothetical protein